jgi:hypothetical protein
MVGMYGYWGVVDGLDGISGIYRSKAREAPGGHAVKTGSDSKENSRITQISASTDSALAARGAAVSRVDRVERGSSAAE